MKEVLKKLRVGIKKNYGKRCKEYSPFCAVCIMWGAFDVINEGMSFVKEK